jgi:hypothetical protein
MNASNRNACESDRPEFLIVWAMLLLHFLVTGRSLELSFVCQGCINIADYGHILCGSGSSIASTNATLWEKCTELGPYYRGGCWKFVNAHVAEICAGVHNPKFSPARVCLADGACTLQEANEWRAEERQHGNL